MQVCNNFMLNEICQSKRESKKGGKDQESLPSSTTPDPGHHM